MTNSTEAAAIASLTADGFKLTDSGKFYAKRGTTHGWDGGHATTALATVVLNRVDPKWNSPDYFTLKFH